MQETLQASLLASLHMMTALEVVVRATLLLLAALGATALLRRGPAELRRQIWAGVVGALLLLPVVSLALPRFAVKVLPVAPAALPEAPVDTNAWFWSKDGAGPLLRPPVEKNTGRVEVPRTAVPRAGLAEATLGAGELAARGLLGLYLAGVALFGLRLWQARRRAARLLVHARPAGQQWQEWQVPPSVDLRESDQIELPMTIGSLRPVVLVPAAGRTWLPAWRRAVLAHEAAHVRAADPLLQLLAELAAALYWFHPLVHLAVRRLRTERELAADDAALGSGMPPSEYANLLFELACLPETPPARGAVVPLLTPSGLKTRVLAALDGARSRVASRLSRGGVLAGFLAVGPLALALPAAREGAPPLPLGRGQVMGQAVDQAGQPVPGAEVRFRLLSFPQLTAVVKADDTGWFRYPWDRKPVSEFALYARRDESASRQFILNVPYGTTLPVTLSLRRANTLSGTVRDSSGAPLPGADVRVWHDERSSFGPGRELAVKTDARGQWQLPGLLYGGYRLLVKAPSGVLAYQWVDVQDRDISGITTVIEAEQPVTGHLLDDRERPLGGVRLNQIEYYLMMGGRVQNSKTPTALEARDQTRYIDYDVTAADGSFRLMPRGLFTIPVRATGPDGTVYFGVYNEGGRARILHNVPRMVDVRLTPGVRVSGHVRTRAGQPVQAAVVDFESLSADEQREPTWTDAAGAFTLWVPRRNVVINAHKDSPRGGPPDAQGALLLGEDASSLELVVSR